MKTRTLLHLSSFVIRHSSFVIAAALAVSTVSAMAETVEIRSAADWDNFAKRVNNGERSLDALLVRDVTLSPQSPRCGEIPTRLFEGTFDGNGKTLTLNWTFTGGTENAAPFANAGNNAHIKDLRVAGTIRTDGKFAAGFVGTATDYVYIDRCRSSVHIVSSVNGDATSAGIVGRTSDDYRYVYLTDCLFDGSLDAPNANSCGGLAGFRYRNKSVVIQNCLFAPTSFNVSDSGGYTLVRGGFYSSTELRNGWYTLAYGVVQGNDGTGKTAEELAAALGANWTVENGAAVPVPVVSFVERNRDSSVGTASFTYQGVLRNAQGGALGAGAHRVALRLYDQDNGGSAFWGRSFNVLIDENGLFNIRVGDESGDPIEDVNGEGLAGVISANAGSTLFVGLAIDGEEAEIKPRQKLITVPFATWAADASQTSGDLSVAVSARAAQARIRGGAAAANATAIGAASAGTLAAAGQATVAGDLNVSGAVSGDGSIPLGAIVIWKGQASDIPAGWALCDGQVANGWKTPDLRARFVPGAGGGYSVGKTGGEASHRLTEAELPSHRHSYSFKGADLDLSWKNNNYFYDASRHYNDNNNSRNTNYTGDGAAHENRPPFYALCYIMRVK